jgi:hypothetical protein
MSDMDERMVRGVVDRLREAVKIQGGTVELQPGECGAVLEALTKMGVYIGERIEVSRDTQDEWEGGPR